MRLLDYLSSIETFARNLKPRAHAKTKNVLPDKLSLLTTPSLNSNYRSSRAR